MLNYILIIAVVELYSILFDLIRKNPDAVAHGREGFYFASGGEHNMYDIGKAIAGKLVAIGKGTNPEPSTFTDEEIKLYFGVSRTSYSLIHSLKVQLVFLGIYILGN